MLSHKANRCRGSPCAGGIDSTTEPHPSARRSARRSTAVTALVRRVSIIVAHSPANRVEHLRSCSFPSSPATWIPWLRTDRRGDQIASVNNSDVERRAAWLSLPLASCRQSDLCSRGAGRNHCDFGNCSPEIVVASTSLLGCLKAQLHGRPIAAKRTAEDRKASPTYRCPMPTNDLTRPVPR
jgi:hypothetical protein